MSLYSTPSVLDYFGLLVGSDEQFPLLEAAASIAQDEHPERDVQQVLNQLDQWQARLQSRLAMDASALQRLQVLQRFFYGDLGFAGNANNYYDPENSYLSCVLHTRRGIPISLAVLWLELAQGLGLKARGVGFPGHFLVQVLLPQGRVVLDPFTGKSLDADELTERLELHLHQSEAAQTPNAPLDHYLQSATPREILARMLRNLKEVHRTQRDWQRLLAVQKRLVILLPDNQAELLDRGLAHVGCGHVAEAIQDLEAYLAHADESLDTTALRERVAALRRALD